MKSRLVFSFALVTALVCTLAGAAAKGKATLEVVLAGEEPDTYRFTASRKVTVRQGERTRFRRETVARSWFISDGF